VAAAGVGVALVPDLGVIPLKDLMLRSLLITAVVDSLT
jgi:hypothetical protein